MVDLWGPGAFGAADAAAARPAYTPTDGAGDPETFYKDCSSPAEDDGTEWKSAALNMLLVQLRKVVRSTAVAVSNLSDDLLARAIQIGMNYAVAGGAANAWTVSPSLAPLAYVVGLPFDVVAPGTNSSTTVTVNVSGLGTKPIKRSDGADPQIGDLVAGTLYRTVYDGTNIRISGQLPSQARAAAFQVNRVIFTATGAYSWTVPAGVTRIRVKAWGGGGGGGASNNPSGAAGGGSGAYGEQAIDVVPGQTVTGSVGAGGTAGISGGGAAPGNGGNTTVVYGATTYTAGGGVGAANIGSGAGVGNSVSGGTTTNFVDTARIGSPSAGGLQGYSGSGTLYYGGKGGDAPNGGVGGNAGTGAPNPGATPGGGGAGGGSNGGNTNGAVGARGEVWIEY
jgi:hypothetical protein